MKKSSKIAMGTVGAVIGVGIISFCGFLYHHGNTKPYKVPKEVHNAIISQKEDKGENEVRIMSSNLLVSYNSWHSEHSRQTRSVSAKPRAKMYLDLLNTYKPDVVGVQEMCDMWYNCLMRNALNYKLCFPVSTALTVRMTGLMYNADTTEILEKGQYAYSVGNNSRLRRIVWGLFKDKATGKKYIVASTHLDFITSDREFSLNVMETQMNELLALSKELKDKYNVPIFHVGDFNSLNNVENWREEYYNLSEEELEKINEDEIKLDAAPSIYLDLAEKLNDTKLSAKKFNAVSPTTINSPTYDHIFLDGEATVNNYTIISDTKMRQMSDHYSIFADVEL